MGRRANVTRSCDLCLKSVASCIRCRGNFRETSGRQHVPPTEEAALARSAHFAAGRNLQIYLPHLEKACFSLGRDFSWKTRAATQAAKGLARAGDRRHEPKPAAPRPLYVKIVSRHPLTDPFAQAVLVSWMFRLRLQSECLQPVRQPPHEKMDPDSIWSHQRR